jgi:hypothetical protein
LEMQQGLNEFRGEVNDALRDLSRKIGVLGNDMIQLRADQTHAESRLDSLEWRCCRNSYGGGSAGIFDVWQKRKPKQLTASATGKNITKPSSSGEV